MLLRFKVSNYKSFLNEIEFSMIPAPKQKDLEYSILEKEAANKTYRALCSSVIYGPNASGKTNIIGALETFINIVKKGHLRNDDQITTFNASMHKLEFIPNSSLLKPKPTTFLIEFIMDDSHIEYELEIELGLFLDQNYERKVSYEKLRVNNKDEFERIDKNIIFYNGNTKYSEHLLPIINDNLEKNSIFLTNGFKNVINKELSNKIIDYLTKKILIFYRSDSIRLNLDIPKDRNYVFLDDLSNVAKEFDSSGEHILFVSNKEGPSRLVTSLKNKDNNDVFLPVDMIESYGTFRFLNLYPFIKKVLKEGGTLIVDEFDASLHPMVIMDIIKIFHNDEKNINQAQLIFNTHNPIFLRNTLFRRDEIKFVEKEDNSSTLYTLADFGTSGEKGVRNTEDYMKNYFVNKYGSISDVDLSNLFT